MASQKPNYVDISDDDDDEGRNRSTTTTQHQHHHHQLQQIPSRPTGFDFNLTMAGAGNNMDVVDDGFRISTSTISKHQNVDKSMGELRDENHVLRQKNRELSEQLLSYLHRDMDTSIDGGGDVRNSDDSSHKAATDSFMAQLRESAAREKSLFETTVKLREDLTAAQLEATEKKRVEIELARMKDRWKRMNELREITGGGASNFAGVGGSQGTRTPDSTPRESPRIQEETTKLKAEIDRLRAENFGLKSELTASKNVSDGPKVDVEKFGLENEIQGLKLQNQRLARAEEEYRLHRSTCAQNVKCHAELVANLQEENRRLKDENVDLATKKCAEVRQLGIELVTIRQQNELAADENAQLRLESFGYQNEVHNVQSLLETANKRIVELETEARVRTNQMTELRNALERGKTDVSKARETSRRHATTLTAISSEFLKLKEDYVEIKGQWVKMADDIMATMEDHQSASWKEELARMITTAAAQRVTAKPIKRSAAMAASTSTAATEPNLATATTKKMFVLKLMKDREMFERKYVQLRNAVLAYSYSQAASQRIIQAIALGQDNGVVEGGPSNTPAESTEGVSSAQRLQQTTRKEIKRLKPIVATKLAGKDNVKEVLDTTSSIWQTIQNVATNAMEVTSTNSGASARPAQAAQEEPGASGSNQQAANAVEPQPAVAEQSMDQQ